MKAVRCKECGRIIGYSENEYPKDDFLCVLCTEDKIKRKKSKSASGLKTASGFIVIRNNSTAFRDFGKKPKSRLNKFYIGLIEENYQPESGSFFDRNCLIYKMENGEFLVKIKLPNNKDEYYLIKNDEVIDYFIEK